MGAGHEEGRDIGHHAGHGVSAVRCKLLDLLLRHTDVIQPFLTDLLAGTITHGLLYIVARLVSEQTVEPHAHGTGLLIAELRLTVDGPGKQPVGILDGHDTARDHATRERITPADTLDVGQDLVVQGGDSSAFPIAELRCRAEFLRMTELRALDGNALP